MEKTEPKRFTDLIDELFGVEDKPQDPPEEDDQPDEGEE